MQNTWTAGVEREEEEGHRFARAKAAGVQHFVYAFTDPRFKNLEIDIAGDAVTLPQAANIARQILGRPLTYVQILSATGRAASESGSRLQHMPCLSRLLRRSGG